MGLLPLEDVCVCEICREPQCPIPNDPDCAIHEQAKFDARLAVALMSDEEVVALDGMN